MNVFLKPTQLTSIVLGTLSSNICLALSQFSGFPKMVTISLTLGARFSSGSSTLLISSGSRLLYWSSATQAFKKKIIVSEYNLSK